MKTINPQNDFRLPAPWCWEIPADQRDNGASNLSELAKLEPSKLFGERLADIDTTAVLDAGDVAGPSCLFVGIRKVPGKERAFAEYLYLHSENGPMQIASTNHPHIQGVDGIWREIHFRHGKTSRECTGIEDSHEYAERECPRCEGVFCFSCSGGSSDSSYHSWIRCPDCGHMMKL